MKPLNDTVDSIREINLSYLTLARRLLQEDKAVGMRCLGLSKEIADTLTALTLAQVVKFAESNHLLCFFSFRRSRDAICSDISDHHGRRHIEARCGTNVWAASRTICLSTPKVMLHTLTCPRGASRTRCAANDRAHEETAGH